MIIDRIRKTFITMAQPVHTEKWQGLSIADRPEAEMMEQMFVNIKLQLPATQEDLVRMTRPNMPWAEDHFLRDRVGEQPVNPGYTWQDWPWANTADDHRDERGQFNHSYAERYWPKHAGLTPLGELHETQEDLPVLQGIRYPYGDLNDVIRLLQNEPNTRQAYMPVFFPEDTGVVHGSRVPCSIGYHFIHRHGYLHCVYQLRSCDIYRHLGDDLYLTARLLQYVADAASMKTGMLDVHISSLHCFINDYRKMKDET